MGTSCTHHLVSRQVQLLSQAALSPHHTHPSHPPTPPTCTPPPKVLPTLTEVEAAVKGAAEERRLEAAELELEIEGYKVVAL